jgi:hypothetical protein
MIIPSVNATFDNFILTDGFNQQGTFVDTRVPSNNERC